MAVFGCHTRRLPAQLLTVPLFATCLIASATVSCYVGIWNTGPSIARPHRVHTLTAACFSRAGAGGHLDRHSAVTVVRRRRGAVGTAVLTSVQRTACARTRVNCEATSRRLRSDVSCLLRGGVWRQCRPESPVALHCISVLHDSIARSRLERL